MRLIYSLINRSRKADGLLELKIVINKEDYILLKYSEERKNMVTLEFNEDEIKFTSDNITVEVKKVYFGKIVSFNVSLDAFERVEKEDVWESKSFIIRFATPNVTPKELYQRIKKQIETIMGDLKARVQLGDDPCWEESEELTY